MKNKKTELLTVQMLDGSIFVMPNEYWQKAFELKYGDRKEEAIEAFKQITKKHFEARTCPTKFGIDEVWEEGEYSTHAELGKEVMYVYIRAALLAVAMEAVAKEQGIEKTPKVVGIGKDGEITEYTGHSVRRIKRTRWRGKRKGERCG